MVKCLQKELGVKYYDREILRLASDESGINEALFGKADEKLKSTSLFKIAKKSFDGKVISPESDDFVSNDNLFNYQAKIIKQLAEEESCVIIGRCANYVLKNHKNAIRIFCYGELEDCVKREMELNHHEEKESRKLIAKIDKNRADYYKYYTNSNWSDARHYDMCINTSSLSYEEILGVVKSFIELVNKR